MKFSRTFQKSYGSIDFKISNLLNIYLIKFCLCIDIYHPAGDMTRVSVMPRKDTVKIGDAENRCRGCRDKHR